MTAMVSPAAQALTTAKYAITYEPATGLAYALSEGYYASATWYQPKRASSYSSLGRFGKGDWVTSYCISGATSTSYFTAPEAAQQLTGAAYFAAGSIVFATALAFAI